MAKEYLKDEQMVKFIAGLEKSHRLEAERLGLKPNPNYVPHSVYREENRTRGAFGGGGGCNIDPKNRERRRPSYEGLTFYGNLIIKDWGGDYRDRLFYYDSLVNCKKMVGDVVLEIHTSPLPKFTIEEIIGNFSVHCTHFYQEHLDKFSKVKKIKGNVSFKSLTTSLKMDSLEEIEGDLVVDSYPYACSTVSFKSLKKIGGNLIIQRTGTAALPALAEIGGTIQTSEQAHCTLPSNVKIGMNKETYKSQPQNTEMTPEQLNALINARVEKMLTEKLQEFNLNSQNIDPQDKLDTRKILTGLKGKEKNDSLQQ